MERTHSRAEEKCEKKGKADRKLLCIDGNTPPSPIPPSGAWGGLGSEGVKLGMTKGEGKVVF